MRRPVVVLIAVATAILLWLAWQQTRPQKFIVSGFIEADQIRIGSRVGGRVSAVPIEEGDAVKTGQVLFELDPFDVEARLAAAQANYDRLSAGYRSEEVEQARARAERAKAMLDRAVAGPRPQEISIARENVKSRRATLALSEAELKRAESLVRNDQVSKERYDEAVRGHTAAAADLQAAEQNLKLLEEGTRKEDLAAARAEFAEADQALKLMEQGFRKEDVAQAAAELDAAKARAAELTVRAPCDCVVEAVEIRPGDLVRPDAPALSLLDRNRMWVRTYVPEARLAQIRLGDKVPIRVDGIPDERFTGLVGFVAQEGEFTPRNIQTPEERSKQVFRVKLRLQDGRDRLRVGMAADVLFGEAAGD